MNYTPGLEWLSSGRSTTGHSLSSRFISPRSSLRWVGALVCALAVATAPACGDDVGPDGISSFGDGMGSGTGAGSSAGSESRTTGASDGNGTVDDGKTSAAGDGADSTTGTTGTQTDGTSTGGTGLEGCRDDAECDNGLFCDGVETCSGGTCQAGVMVACDDGVDCTVDACDEVAGACVSIAQDALCDNAVFCDGVEVCDPATGCEPGVAIACDDGVGCTIDSCDEDTQACVFAPDSSVCDNGSVCDGAEVCDPALGCQAGTPLDCNDFIPCTADACSEGAMGCTNTPTDALCDNGIFCDGAEVCSAGVGCEPGPPVSCPDDGVACTVDACDEGLQACTSTPDNDACMGGQFCHPTLDCVPGDPCSDDGDCDDGLACNGAETCDLSAGAPGTCQSGTAIICSDGVSCTVDSCEEPGGTCAQVALDLACDDGDPCNGAETCDPVADCQPGAPPTCEDGIACTLDTCITGFGCNNVPLDAPCSDGVICNGVELCDAVLGCQPAASPTVCASDGVACTNEFCDEAAGGCVVETDDDLCACGETCHPTLGCDDACNVATCDGQIWQCGNCLDDDGDCDIDDGDAECFGPCDNNEAGFKGEIPGQNSSPCKHDCYFDDDSGSGNDDCFWSHECDPLEPSAPQCEFDPDANIPGTPMDCDEAMAMQSTECDDVCGPLTPNGCDCFGCCEVFLPAGGSVTVYLGTEDDGGDGTCSMADVTDPMLCAPCTQVPGCLNPCQDCELCFGQTQLPPECTVQDCEDEQQPCGLLGQAPCPVGGFCITGCCVFF